MLQPSPMNNSPSHMHAGISPMPIAASASIYAANSPHQGGGIPTASANQTAAANNAMLKNAATSAANHASPATLPISPSVGQPIASPAPMQGTSAPVAELAGSMMPGANASASGSQVPSLSALGIPIPTPVSMQMAAKQLNAPTVRHSTVADLLVTTASTTPVALEASQDNTVSLGSSDCPRLAFILVLRRSSTHLNTNNYSLE